MSQDLTYETVDRSQKLERIEWDYTWCQCATDRESKRVLTIGDSISFGYRLPLNEVLAGKVHADNYATSKAIDNPYYFDCVKLFAAQNPAYSMIQLNNGLHGFHLDTPAYQENYRAFIEKLLAHFPGVPLVLALSTPVRLKEDPSRFGPDNDIVLSRNRAVRELAEEFRLPVNDLYSPIAPHPELSSPDTVHLTPEGYRILAEQTADLIHKTI